MLLVRLVLYNGLLIGAFGYAWLRGRREERLAAAVCVVASFASLLLLTRLRFSEIEYGILAVDLAVLAAFVAVALRSERFWPLWVSGLQMTSTVPHVLKLIDPGLMPFAYAAAETIWSYPILIIIAIGTWRVERYRALGPPSAA